MSARAFDSIISSPLGAAVKSPLNVRDAGGSNRAVYTVVGGNSFSGTHFVLDSEKILRLSLDDLTQTIAESRPPWWPAPDSRWGLQWAGDAISGDANTVWYSAFNMRDFHGDNIQQGQLDERWTIDIYKLNGQLEVVNSWRWHQPELGGGRAWHIAPFGDSTALWGLARVHAQPQPWRHGGADPGEMYLVELDPQTMEIRRASADLWGGGNADFRIRRRYATAGGGNSSVIWVSRRFNDPDRQRFMAQIMEYDPRDFSLVRVTDGPRSAAQGTARLEIDGIGGDSGSIWLAQHRPTGTFIGSILSELPRDFTNDNRTILQDELRAPVVEEGQFRFTHSIG